MNDKLREELTFLEEGYFGQPPFLRDEDLEEINRIRAELGVPEVDDQLVEIGGKVEAEGAAPMPEPVPEAPKEDPHAKAKEIYQSYLDRDKELEQHRAYALKVVDATEDRKGGMTPVRPLAIMGTNGGPLLCDYCKKPILLEGGGYNGKTADVAWAENPDREKAWTSWILGGLVVEVHTNGTLRVYHGYPNQKSHCCTKAIDEEERQPPNEHKYDDFEDLHEYIKLKHPELDGAEQQTLVYRILDTLFDDPGTGINHP